MRIDHFIRQPDNRWLVSQATQPDDVVEIDAINCELRLAEVYDKVPMDPTADERSQQAQTF